MSSSKILRLFSINGQQSGNTPWTLIVINALATLLVLQRNCALATPFIEETLPHLCDSVRCPSASEIVCPNDSDERESFASPPAGLISSSGTTENHIFPNTSHALPHDDLYIQCCVAQKCLCRTCHVLDCHGEHEVVYELRPESMDMPGKCCGLYECRAEPNCTDVRDTESYWLTNCQRCKCFGGERICHQSCDEGLKKSTAICNSKNLNRFFENGQTWKYGCYECECVNGEEKCVIPFCRSVNCPHERQVFLKDSCCPICWPANITMPDAQDAEYEEEPLMPLPEEEHDIIGNYDDEDEDAENDGDEEDKNKEEEEEVANVSLPKGNPITIKNDTSEDMDVLPNISFDNDLANNTITSSTRKAMFSTSSTMKIINFLPIATTTTTTPNITRLVVASAAPEVPASVVTATVTDATIATATTSGTLPCLTVQPKHEMPATYQVYPEVVEVVRQTQQNDLLYAVIGCLALTVLLLIAWNVHLRAKQRSYRPVSNFDDNFNKMSASNIKKMNDYV